MFFSFLFISFYFFLVLKNKQFFQVDLHSVCFFSIFYLCLIFILLLSNFDIYLFALNVLNVVFKFFCSNGGCRYTVLGQKKGTMLNWSSSLNFWDMTTLILSKERMGPGKFYGIILKVRQLLVVSLMAQNQKCKNKFCSFLYPELFFASLICSVYNIDF